MSTQPLFLDTKLHFDGEEKIAGTMTRLGDNIDYWQQEITQEAFKRLPFLSDFEVNVVLDKVDEERGFAFGSVEVSPRTEMTQQEANKSGLGQIHIPIVVKDQMLCPFDVFIDGKEYKHLSEGRVRGSLFRPEAFDAMRKSPPIETMYNDLIPPLERNLGYGFGSGSKTASADLPLLPQLQGRVLDKHAQRLEEALRDVNLRTAVANGDEGVKAAFASASLLQPIDLEKSASVAWDAIRPTVVQLTKLANGNVMLKHANVDMYAPQHQEITPDMANELLGDADLVGRLEADGSITASPDAAAKQTLEAEEVRTVDQFGLWQVQDTMGNKLVGYAFPQLLSMDLQPMPLTLFTNGSQYGLQDSVAGKFLGKSTDIPRATPRGYGAFYYLDHGTAKAFVPLSVTTTFRGPDGVLKYMCNTDLGESVTISMGEGLKTVAKVTENEYVVPSHFTWLPLKAHTELVPEPMLFEKSANVSWKGTVELLGDAGVFTYRGGPLHKLAASEFQFIDRNQAEFLGVAMGVDMHFIKEALDRASKGERIDIQGVRSIIPVAEKLANARTAIRRELSEELPHPIRNYNLIKEAAILDDALTADKVLGLGFLNAENVATFVDMLPGLEVASSKLAEMLIASRLGMKDVPEVALERCLVALEDVVKGLRALQQKELKFNQED